MSITEPDPDGRCGRAPAGMVESHAMLPTLRRGPAAVGATALATAAAVVAGLIVAASLSTDRKSVV